MRFGETVGEKRRWQVRGGSGRFIRGSAPPRKAVKTAAREAAEGGREGSSWTLAALPPWLLVYWFQGVSYRRKKGYLGELQPSQAELVTQLVQVNPTATSHPLLLLTCLFLVFLSGSNLCSFFAL